IQEIIPNCCIGVDVIVGFPGEGEKEFESTYNFLKDLGVSYLHVFTYSERANTTALRKEDVIPKEVRYVRTRQLNILSTKLQRAFYKEQAGHKRAVLWEKDEHNGLMQGYTDNYIRVCAPFQADYLNKISEVTLTEINSDGIYLTEEFASKSNLKTAS
ncbi:MAG: tRNA (N(6)-L-threonylcarbamoyladenosine(37)-C(2))-methylthiotransferase MtaB, partial [Luteibaculum sp.]